MEASKIPHSPSVVFGRPLIKGIRLLPQPACANQPLAVAVDTKDPDGLDGEVIISADGQQGNPVTTEIAEPGPHWLLVTATNQRGDYDQRNVLVNVEQCGAESAPLKVISHNAGATGIAGLQALLPARAKRDDKWIYHWDFGDGSSSTGPQSYVTHDYRGRPQTGEMSSFFVRVAAQAPSGTIKGMTSVRFLNLYALNRDRKGVIAPIVILRDSGISGSTAYIDATVRHSERAALRVRDIASVSLGACKPGETLPDPELDSSMFSTETFPPGESDLRVEIPTSIIGDACTIVIALTGEGPGGMPIRLYVSGQFRELAPTVALKPAYVAAHPQAQAQIDTLNQAAALLGREVKPGTRITDEELQVLRASGALTPPPAPLPSP